MQTIVYKVWLLLVVVLCCHGNHGDNEVVKRKSYEEKLLQSVNNLRDHVVALEQQISYIRRKTKHSFDILKRLEAVGENNIGCADFNVDTGKTGRKSSLSCPPQFPLERHGDCYMVQSEKTTWQRARDKCAELSGHLVAIETNEEQKFLLDHINAQKGIQHCDFWTGGTDQLVEGRWVWNNTGQALTYTSWHTWEPNNGGGVEHCMWLDWYFGWEWNDATCDRQTACYICEKRRN